jgi:hypothetical protein
MAAPSIENEPINGNYIQTLCYLGNKFTPTNGSWMQTFASEFAGEFNTGSYLLDMAYGIWLDTIGIGDFELVNGNCWQSLFVWTGLKDMADALAVTYPKFGQYPYNGSWENTIMQLLIIQNSGVIPMPSLGIITVISYVPNQTNAMGANQYNIQIDGDTNGVGAIFKFSATTPGKIKIAVINGGLGYTTGQVLFVPGDTVPGLSNDLYITINTVI